MVTINNCSINYSLLVVIQIMNILRVLLLVLALTLHCRASILSYSSLEGSSAPSGTQVIKSRGKDLAPLQVNQPPYPLWVWVQNSSTNSCPSSYSFTISQKVICTTKPLVIIVNSTGSLSVTVNNGPTPQSSTNQRLVLWIEQKQLVCGSNLSISISVSHPQSTSSQGNCDRFGVVYMVEQEKCCQSVYGIEYSAGNCTCTPRCGDGVYIPMSEQCDDGNLMNKDGCDSNCKIEDNHQCFAKRYEQSQCFQKHTVKLRQVTKNELANKMMLHLEIIPAGKEFEKFNFSENVIVHSDRKLVLTWYQYQLENKSQLLLEYQYFESMERHSFNLSFLPINLSQATRVLNDVIIHRTDLLSYFNVYDPSVYQNAKYVKVILRWCMIITYSLLFIGIFTQHKFIALQVLFLYKYTYFCLAAYSNVSPITHSLISQLKYSNGYNIKWEMFRDSPKLFNMRYENTMLGNVNIMILVLIVSGGLYFLLRKYQVLKTLKSFFANIFVICALIGSMQMGFCLILVVYDFGLVNLISCALFIGIFLAIRNLIKFSDICQDTEQFNFQNYADTQPINRGRGRRQSTTDPYPCACYLLQFLQGTGMFNILSLLYFLLIIAVIVMRCQEQKLPAEYKDKRMNQFIVERDLCVVVVYILSFIALFSDHMAIQYITIVILVFFTLYSIYAMIHITIMARIDKRAAFRERNKEFEQKEIDVNYSKDENRRQRSLEQLKKSNGISTQEKFRSNENPNLHLLEQQ